MSLHMIPRARWHNAMKAPPCMRWRGLHPAFVARAARFLRPISHLSAFTDPLAILKRRLPNASAAVSRPHEVSPAVPIPPRRPSVSVTSIFYSCRASPARGSTNVFKISDVSTAPSTESDELSPEFTIFFTGCPHPGTRSDSEMAHAAAAARLSMMPTTGTTDPTKRLVTFEGGGLAWQTAVMPLLAARRAFCGTDAAPGDRPAVWMTTCCPPSRVPGRARESPPGMIKRWPRHIWDRHAPRSRTTAGVLVRHGESIESDH